MNIKVIGIGGIASGLLPPLSRYVAHVLQEDGSIILVDGDRYEEGNRTRQDVRTLGNKAEVTAEYLSSMFPLHFVAKPTYVTAENIASIILEGDTVFLCVDNHATRKLVSDHCEDLDEVVVISGGNRLTDGNVQIFVRKDGESVTPPLADPRFHPEIAEPADVNPGETGCEDLTESAPQLIITNNIISAWMLGAFYAFTQGELGYSEIFVDVLTGNARAVLRETETALAR